MDILKKIIDFILCPWRLITKQEDKMDLIQMLNNLIAQISELQAKLVDAQKALDEQVKAAYDKGFADGVNSVQVPPSDKIYSQEDLDNAVKLAVEPLQIKITELEGVVAGFDAKLAEEIMKVKAEIKSKLDALEETF